MTNNNQIPLIANNRGALSSLFGTEDVDLRIPPMGQINAQPVLPIAVAADITMGEPCMVEQPINQHLQRPKAIDENSQDSNDKFKTILLQAKEQVENGEVNPDEIESMVQQLMKAKSESEARKKLKRTSASALTLDGDEVNEVFSSDSGDDAAKQSHRIPKRRRPDEPKNGSAAIAATGKHAAKSPAKDGPTKSPPKERRVRKTKWNSPWEERGQTVLPMQAIPNNIMPGINFAPIVPTAQPLPLPLASGAGVAGDVDQSMRQFSSRNAAPSVWQQPNFMPMNSAHMPGILPPTLVGPIAPQLLMAQHGSNLVAGADKERTINIDGIPREIRFYEETAIAFMDGTASREPKEIGFQAGERRLCVDNNEAIVLAFNDSYKPFIIHGKPYQIRFGSPTRELYIDNEWYECYFGDPAVGIVLDGNLHSFRVDGPAPQVRIGCLRTDLVAGKVDMYVDINIKVSLFLDAQEQMFQVNNKMHSIQFADYFLTVLIDNVPYPVQYGSMPTKYRLDNSDHYIRFSVLPNDIVPGKVFVRNMTRTPLHRDLASPPPPKLSSRTNDHNDSNVIAPSESSGAPGLPVDVNDLYRKLLAVGILNTAQKDKTPLRDRRERVTPISLAKPDSLKKRQAGVVSTLYSGFQCSSCGLRFPNEQSLKQRQHLDWHYRQNRRERDSARKAHSRKWYYEVADWIQYEEIENVDEREKNYFEAQQNDVDSDFRDSNQQSAASPPPSCAAGPDDHNRACDMCHDAFETFFHEETEEWHLRNAIRFEDKTFHPDCLDDYRVSVAPAHNNAVRLRVYDRKQIFTFAAQDSLKAVDTTLNASVLEVSADDNAVDMHVDQDTVTGSISVLNAEEKIPVLDDDDDVIVLPQEEPVVTEIADDEEVHDASTSMDEPTVPAASETTTPASDPDATNKELLDAEQPENAENHGKNHRNSPFVTEIGRE